MFMALGLKNSSGDLQTCDTKPQTMRLVRELAAKFKDKNGSIVCRELKGVDTGKCCEAVMAVSRMVFGFLGNIY